VPWIVLEELVLDAAADELGRLVATVDVRRLAARLGLAKDTVAKAVKRLDAAGVVGFESERERAGRFGRGRYVLRLSTTGIAPVRGVPCPNVQDEAGAGPAWATPRRDAARADRPKSRLRRQQSRGALRGAPTQLALFSLDDTSNASDDAGNVSNDEPITSIAPDTAVNSRHPDPTAKPTDALAPEVRTGVNAHVNGAARPC